MAVLDKKGKAEVVGRLGKPEDVANVMLFLASEAADYVTGQNYSVGYQLFERFGWIGGDGRVYRGHYSFFGD